MESPGRVASPAAPTAGRIEELEDGPTLWATYEYTL